MVDVGSWVHFSLSLELHEELLLDWRQSGQVDHLWLWLSQVLEVHRVQILEAEGKDATFLCSQLVQVLVVSSLDRGRLTVADGKVWKRSLLGGWSWIGFVLGEEESHVGYADFKIKIIIS